MKKILAIALSAAMMLSISLSASAQSKPTTEGNEAVGSGLITEAVLTDESGIEIPIDTETVITKLPTRSIDGNECFMATVRSSSKTGSSKDAAFYAEMRVTYVRSLVSRNYTYAITNVSGNWSHNSGYEGANPISQWVTIYEGNGAGKKTNLSSLNWSVTNSNPHALASAKAISVLNYRYNTSSAPAKLTLSVRAN